MLLPSSDTTPATREPSVEPGPETSAARPALAEALSSLARDVESAQAESNAAASSADMVVMNVKMVDAMMSQVHHGIEGVAGDAEQSRQAAEAALAAVRTTAERIGELVEIARQIADVTKLIDTIARQTNMLALNATIEAARAGEAGRGFSVVAAEVKALARQTSEATADIGRKIKGIGGATAGATKAMHTTEESVARIHELVGKVSASVVEQNELTASVKTYVNEAAGSVEEIAGNITNFNTCIEAALARARGALEAAG